MKLGPLLLALLATSNSWGQTPSPSMIGACLAGHLLGDTKIAHTIYTIQTNHGQTIELCTWQLNERGYVYQYEGGSRIVPDINPDICLRTANEGIATATEEVSNSDAEAIATQAIAHGDTPAQLSDACLVYASAMYYKEWTQDQPDWIAIMLSPPTSPTPEELAKGARPTKHAVLLWEKNQTFYRIDTLNPKVDTLTGVSTPQEAKEKYFTEWTLNNEQGG